jgi:hypothetical protein
MHANHRLMQATPASPSPRYGEALAYLPQTCEELKSARLCPTLLRLNFAEDAQPSEDGEWKTKYSLADAS